jgi:hypothetical protein
MVEAKSKAHDRSCRNHTGGIAYFMYRERNHLLHKEKHHVYSKT